MNWTPLTSQIDYIKLAGRRSPGLADVSGAGSPRKWDVRKGYALSGATTVYRGMDVARFKVTLRLYSEQHWEDWHAWKALVQRPPSGVRPRALDIWHPVLEECGIKSAVVENVGQPRQTGDSGEWSITIDFIEYRPRQTLSTVVTEGSESTAQPESETQRLIREERALAEEIDRENERAAKEIERRFG